MCYFYVIIPIEHIGNRIDTGHDPQDHFQRFILDCKGIGLLIRNGWGYLNLHVIPFLQIAGDVS